MNDPILVVGAGPVGLVAAAELARGGIPVRIIDVLPAPSPWSKAVAVHSRTMEHFRSLGVDEEILASGVTVPRVSLVSGDRTLAEVDFSAVESAFPYMVCLPQDATEAILTDKLLDLGVEIERGVELVGLTQDDTSATATFRDANGETEATFSYVAGCDGGHSTVRRLVGTQLEGTFHGVQFLLADCDAEHDLDRDRMIMFFHDSGMLGLFPLQGKRCRLVIQLEHGLPTGSEPTLEATQRLADERTGSKLRLHDPRWLTSFEIHFGQVPRYRYGRAFLAGDAAHIHSPAGGQGMNTGIQDAANLGWKLRLAWAGAASPGLLDSYHAERHPVGASVVRLSTLMTRGGTARGTVAQHARNVLAALVLGHTRAAGGLVDRIAETSTAYHESPIVGGLPRSTSNGGLRPGDHAPDAGGLENVLDPTVHTIVHVAGTSPEPSRAAAVAMHRNFGPLVRNVLVVGDATDGDGFDEVLVDPAGAVAARYGSKDGLLVIVRPDGYLAYLGEPVDLTAAERLLSTTIA